LPALVVGSFLGAAVVVVGRRRWPPSGNRST
jgi:hypothetical protein